MGMFDYVRCEYKMPNPEPMDDDFQTKDTNCNMDRYTIDAGGILWVERWSWDHDKDESIFLPKEYAPYHGTMNFYGHTKQTGRWKEYQVDFKYGQICSEIVCVK